MTSMKLEDVESYLVKRLQEKGYNMTDGTLHENIREIFAELRAREEAKGQAVKQ